MSREGAIARAQAYFDSGAFASDLPGGVAIPSPGQERDRAPVLPAYRKDEIGPPLNKPASTGRVLNNPKGPPILVAARTEAATAPAILIYGHGDTIRGLDGR